MADSSVAPELTTSKLDHALALIADGFFVFPLLPWPLGRKPGKVPPEGMHFKELATRDVQTIKTWWAENPDYNIGIYTGKFGDMRADGGFDALLAVDVDAKGNKDGFATIEKWKAEGLNLPKTRVTETPTGGCHLIYRVSHPVRQGVERLGDGIDHRSLGGYVVAPGSIIDGKRYESISDAAVSDAPGELVARCGQARDGRPANGSQSPPANVNRERAIHRYRDFLRTEAPIAVEGEGGDHTTFKVAARGKDEGLAAVDTLSVMLEDWNPRCEPSWDPMDLEQKVHNAYRYGLESIGARAPEMMFTVKESLEKSEGVATEKRRFKAKMLGDIKPKLDLLWAIDGVLPAGGLAILIAEPGKAKTLSAIEMGFAVARGVQWHGRDTLPGAVLYFSAEGQLANRLEARRRHERLGSKQIPFAAIEDGANLRNNQIDVAGLIDAAQEVSAQTGVPLRLVIVDTLAQTMAGGAENSAEDMGAVISNLGRIKRETGAAVLVIHHLGKDTNKGARGHSSLLGAADTSLEIEDSAITIKKQRDGETGRKFPFEILSVEIGTDTKGRPVTSAVVVPDDGREFERASPKAKTSTAKVLQVAQDLALSRSKPGRPTRISVPEWRAEFVARNYPDSVETGQRVFRKRTPELVRMGWIVMEGDYALVND